MPDYQVLIVGAGLSGIAMAIQITQKLKLDRSQVAIFERGQQCGGTWNFNTYPGAACDVPSIFYSYSFAPLIPKKTWEAQADILEYIKATARSYGVDRQITFSVECVKAEWVDKQGHWIVTLRIFIAKPLSILKSLHEQVLVVPIFIL